MSIAGAGFYPQSAIGMMPGGIVNNMPPPGLYPPPTNAVYSRMNNFPTNIVPGDPNNIIQIKSEKRKKKNKF